MKQTGELLKQAREAARLSISEVALATKINPKILAGIESGDTEHQPAQTFLKGFIRSYAAFLKLDPEEVMRVYYSEQEPPNTAPAGSENAESVAEPAAAPPPPKRRMTTEEHPSGPRVVAILVILVLIGAIIGIRELIEKYQREQIVESDEIKVSPLEEETVEAKPAKEPVAEAAPAPAAVAQPAVPPPGEAPKPDLPKPETVAKPAPVPAPPAPPPPAPTPEPVKVQAQTPPPTPAPAQPQPTPPPAPSTPPTATPTNPQAAVVKSGKYEIIVEALDKVEVKFSVDGKQRSVILAPTEVHTIFASGATVINFSDGGAVNLIVNGRDRGVPGDLGKPAQVTIP
ncbi:MAG: helix-turn-helix domain-containing protein [Bdellovibrionales bacterium]